jgi:hypothetical protein
MNSSRELKVIFTGAINRSVENLDMNIKIEKSLSTIPNQATIKIYNLKRETRQQLQNKKENVKLSVYLKEKLMFTGELVNSNTILNRQTAEFETMLWCGDGVTGSKAETTVKVEKGSTKKDAVNIFVDELSDFGISKGDIDKFRDCTGGKSLLKSIVKDGNIVENLKKIINECLPMGESDQDVFVEDGKVNILPKDEFLNNNIVTINKGLLTPPTLTDTGVSIIATLDLSPKIGGALKIDTESKNVAIGNLTSYKQTGNKISGEGLYKITSIVYTIDNYSNNIAQQSIGAIII